MHADLVGPVSAIVTINRKKKRARCKTPEGHMWALIVTEEYTHTVFVILMDKKSETAQALINLITWLQVKTGRILERFHSDGGGEFIKRFLLIFFEQNGTRTTSTDPDRPQHNGIAERTNRTLFEVVRSLLIQASAPANLWGEALEWAAHLYNTTPHPITNFETPFSSLFNYRYNLQKLRIWGCDVQVKLLPEKQSKVQSRTWTGIFVGFNRETGSYRIMNPANRTISNSNDVTFNEQSFTKMKEIDGSRNLSAINFSHINPFSEHPDEQLEDDQLYSDASSDSEVVSEQKYDPTDAISDNINSDVNVTESTQSDDGDLNVAESQVDNTDSDMGESAGHEISAANALDGDSDMSEADNNEGQAIEEAEQEPVEADSEVPRETRLLQQQFSSWHNQPTVESDRYTRYGRALQRPSRPIASDPNAYDPADIHQALSERIQSRLQRDDVLNLLRENETANLFIHVDHDQDYIFTAQILGVEPKNYKEAISSAEADAWKAAMDIEYKSLVKMKVWSYVKRPKGVKILKGGWVFKNKLGAENELLKSKARFVAKGYLQAYGRDYHETFAPVAKMKSIKLVLSLTAQTDLELHQLDFDTAFLNAPVEEEIYLEQPEGFNQGGPDIVLKLIKALYGLKQAPRQWNKTIDTFMRKLGYTPLRSDPCVYIKLSKTNKLMILSLYVDDTVIAFHRADRNEWLTDKETIAATYAIKDLGECNWILNMKVTRERNKHTITLSQQAFIERITQQYGVNRGKSPSTPLDTNDLWKPKDGSIPIPLEQRESELYRSIVGALLYAANITRIDIAYAVGRLCRYTTNPHIHQLEAARRVLQYIHDTPELCLIFGQVGYNSFVAPKIEAYCDSDWSGDKQDGKSTSGCVIRFNGDVMNWVSKKQKSVAMSSAEAEYIAIAEAVKEVLWYRSWIIEVLKQYVTGTIHCDNQAAITLTANDTIHERSKHIRLRYHFIRDEVQKKHITMSWVRSAKQQADILTKALDTGTFTRLRSKLLATP